jgi:hypothetical protein
MPSATEPHDERKETDMFRITATIAAALLFGSSWLSGFTLPRLTGTGADYLLMPLLGYLTLIIVANGVARLLPETDQR